MTEKTLRVQDDTSIHVAQFLQEGVGATRQTRIVLDHLSLDDDLAAQSLEAEIRLTRIPTGILASGQLIARVTLQCIRCLEEFTETVRADFADEYRPSVDVLTGSVLAPDEDNEDEDEYFTITGQHLLDVRESLRQALVLWLPMAPLCREDCAGLPELQETQSEGDARLAVLAKLLADTAEAAGDDMESGQGRRRQRRVTAND